MLPQKSNTKQILYILRTHLCSSLCVSLDSLPALGFMKLSLKGPLGLARTAWGAGQSNGSVKIQSSPVLCRFSYLKVSKKLRVKARVILERPHVQLFIW